MDALVPSSSTTQLTRNQEKCILFQILIIKVERAFRLCPTIKREANVSSIIITCQLHIPLLHINSLKKTITFLKKNVKKALFIIERSLLQ